MNLVIAKLVRAVPIVVPVLATGTSGCMPSPPQVLGPNPPPSGTAAEPYAGRGASSAPANTPGATSATAAHEGQPDLARHYGTVRALKVQRGQATYYGDSLAGNKTASGETYDPTAFTAAHRRLPFGTIVRVVRLDSDVTRLVYVRITDRGPFAGRERIIDVSRAAAEQLDMIRDGVVDVRVEVVAYPQDD